MLEITWKYPAEQCENPNCGSSERSGVIYWRRGLGNRCEQCWAAIKETEDHELRQHISK
jgi:hypothetical protein